VATPNPYLSLGTTNTMATGYASGFWIDDMTLFYHGKTIDSRVYWPIGRTRIQRRFPSGPSMRASENSMVSSNGSLANWQAASSTDTATYVSTTTSGVTETYHHQPLDFTPNIVFAVAINISAINTMSNTSIYAANRNDSQGTAFNNLKSSTTAITLSNTLSFTNITTLIDTYTEGDAAKTAFIPANYVATGQMEFGIYKS
jgi:hypothetical protein